MAEHAPLKTSPEDTKNTCWVAYAVMGPDRYAIPVVGWNKCIIMKNIWQFLPASSQKAEGYSQWGNPPTTTQGILYCLS